jgi:hypothetical protein
VSQVFGQALIERRDFLVRATADGSPKPKLVTKEGTIPDQLHLLDF